MYYLLFCLCGIFALPEGREYRSGDNTHKDEDGGWHRGPFAEMFQSQECSEAGVLHTDFEGECSPSFRGEAEECADADTEHSKGKKPGFLLFEPDKRFGPEVGRYAEQKGNFSKKAPPIERGLAAYS